MRMFFLLLSLVFMAGCSSLSSKALFSKLDGATVEVRLSSVKSASPEAPGTLVYGHVTVTSANKIASVNLSCIALKNGAYISQKAYVDSVASVTTTAFRASNGEVRVDMYWYFNGLDAQDFDIRTVTIEMTHGNGRCVEYVSQ